MASRMKPKKKSGKLSLKPALEISYVEEQLKGAAGFVPYAVSKEVAQSGDTSKIREIRDSLSKIAKAAGDKPKSALRALADRNLARMFVANPQEFVKMAKAAKEAAKPAFMLLKQGPLAMLFEADPAKTAASLIKIAKAAKGDADDAFWLLGREQVAASFAWDQDRMIDAFTLLCRSPINDKTQMLWLLGKNEIVGQFAQNPMIYAKSFFDICRASGKNYSYSLSIVNNKILPAFANNPEEFSEAFLRIYSSSGNMGKAFRALENFLGDFVRDPVWTSEMFAQMSRICGRRKRQFFSLLSNKDIADALHNDSGEALKLAEASCYSNILHHLGEYAEKGDTGSIAITILALESPFTLEGPYGMGPLPDYKDKWEEGRQLARAAGVAIDDREVFINFAYAKDKIGAEKTKALYKEYGIEYFARYSKKELENLYGHIGENADHRPLLLVAHNKYDFNGAFYHPSRKDRIRKPLIYGGHYNVIFFEAGSEYEFYELAKKFAGKYFGISAFMIGGHGNEGKIRLGPEIGEEAFLDLNDKSEMKLLENLFAEDALVILDSCSTGANEEAIGALISLLWGASLIAPKLPANIKIFLRSQDGAIEDARYDAEHSRFENGKMTY
jgi:hypothetical protein